MRIYTIYYLHELPIVDIHNVQSRTMKIRHLGSPSMAWLACREIRILPFGIVAILAMLVIFGSIVVERIHIGIREKLSAQAVAGAAATAEHLSRILDDAQQSLLAIAGLMQTRKVDGPAQDEVLISVAEQLNLDHAQTAALAVIDHTGQAVLLDRKFSGQRFDVSTRPYFPIALRSAVDSFSYGPPLENINTGKSTISVMLKIAQGGQEKILATAFSLDRLLSYLNRMALGADGFAAVIQRGDDFQTTRIMALANRADSLAIETDLVAAMSSAPHPQQATLGDIAYTLSVSEVAATPFVIVIGYSDLEVGEELGRALRLPGVLFLVTVVLLALAMLSLLVFIGRNILATRNLQRSEQHFRDLIEGSLQGIWIHWNYRLLFANDAAVQMLGFASCDEFLALPSMEAFISTEDRERLRGFHERHMQGEPVPITYEFTAIRKDGQRIVMLNASRRVEWNGMPAVQCAVVDVTEAHHLAKQLAYQASHDDLTGLLNRRAFEEKLSRTVKASRPPGTVHVLCFLDLDQFKIVNDTCGHVAGDELLRQLSALFQRKVQNAGLLARFGGDEFTLLFENRPGHQISAGAQALLDAVDGFRFAWGAYRFKVGLSIGVVAIEHDMRDPDRLLALADNACCIAKEQGRNRIHVYHDADVAVAQSARDMLWIAQLDARLVADRFFLVGQPITHLHDHCRGLHMEVLLRIEADQGISLLPGAFLQAAERYQVISRIDRWVLGKTLAWLAAAPVLLESLEICNINLSTQTLTDKAQQVYFRQMISQSPVPANKLCFEITETAVMTNMAIAVDFINELRSLGCQFALDDFGSGLSSFGYLNTLPIDCVKIDGQFVKDMDRNPINQAIVRAINEVGHVMGKSIVAEHVENARTLDLLREIGVDYAQGNHIGAPQRLESFISAL